MDHDLLAELLEHLEDTGEVPRAWLAAHVPDGDLRRVWAASRDLDAMFQAAAAGAGRPLLVRAACECARAAVAPLRPEELAPLRPALEVTEAWCRGAADASAVGAALLAIEHATGPGDGDASEVPFGYARAAVTAAADSVSHDHPADAAAGAARAARDALAAHAIAEDGWPAEPLFGDDPRWVSATDAATTQIAALVRAHLPCPTLAQLRSALGNPDDR